MINFKSLLALILFSIVLSACAAGHCRGRKPSSDKKVFVYKVDGSKQCEKNTGVSVDKMAAELGEIEVFSKENKADGMMHMMRCGAPTGKINVYEISEKDLEKAKQLKFTELTK